MNSRELLREYLLERYGKRVEPDDSYRPYFNSIELSGYPKKRSQYVVSSYGAIFVRTSNWIKIGCWTDPDTLDRLTEFLDATVGDQDQKLDLQNDKLYQKYLASEKGKN